MKTHYQRLAQYNIWANDIVFEWLSKLDEEQWCQTIISSFNSIKDTSLHVASAEQIWYERLIKKEKPVWLAFESDGEKTNVLAAWADASKKLLDYVNALDDAALTDLLAYKRINGEAYEQPIGEILTHVFNHSTYHRGQLVTMLRQAGFADVTSTDYLLFSRL